MSSFKESTGFCRVCNRQVLVRKEKTDNTYYLLATVLTCGIWAIVGLFANIFNQFEKYRCTVCGSLIGKAPAQVKQAAYTTPIISQSVVPTLVNCPACNAGISSHAAACPKCGQPMRS